MDDVINCPECGNTELFGWYLAYYGPTKEEGLRALEKLKKEMKSDVGKIWKLKDDVLYYWKNNKWNEEKKMNRLACKCGCTSCINPFGKEFLKYRK